MGTNRRQASILMAEIKLDFVCMHHLTTYLYLMGKQARQDLPLNQECKA